MKERDNILRIFQEAKIAFEKEDSFKLSELSNQTINTASRTHDPENIATAVVVYSLGKIVGRQEYKKQKTWDKFCKSTLLYLDSIISALEKSDDEKLRKYLQEIRSGIKGLSGDLKKNIEDVFRKAEINKASKIYEHGISMETTASLLGITMYELALYAGQKEMESLGAEPISVRQRIKFAEELWG